MHTYATVMCQCKRPLVRLVGTQRTLVEPSQSGFRSGIRNRGCTTTNGQDSPQRGTPREKPYAGHHATTSNKYKILTAGVPVGP